MAAGIEIKGLTVRRGQATVLHQLTLDAPLGQVAAIVGRAGSGKSTLLNTILNADGVRSGAIRVCGIDDHHSNRSPGLITWVHQSGSLEPQWTVRENVRCMLRLAGVPIPAGAEVDRALRQSDLPDRTFDLRAHLLTRFESFAVWIAIARLRSTPILLLDEPTAAASPLDARRTAAVIREFSDDRTAVVAATSDQSFADEIADVVLLLEDGVLSRGRVRHADRTSGAEGHRPYSLPPPDGR